MSNIDQADNPNKKIKDIIKDLGGLLVDAFHMIALFAIGASIVWSAITTFIDMFMDGYVTIADILLLFIYLELLAMIEIYFKTNHIPVRYFIYVAITALTRMMIGDIQAHSNAPDLGIIYISSAILILTLAALVIRFGSAKYPYGENTELKKSG